MSAGDQNYSRAAQFKCLSGPTVPLSVWIVPITAASPFSRRPVLAFTWHCGRQVDSTNNVHNQSGNFGLSRNMGCRHTPED